MADFSGIRIGDDCVGKKTGIRERVGWEIPNRYLSGGGVTVTTEFKGPDGTYVVTREQDVARRRASETVTVLIPRGDRLLGDEAQFLLHALFRSSFQDFMTTVYQHQESIRAVLTLEPRDRNDAIDRLLGLSSYRELLRGIAAAKLQEAQREMGNSREDFRRRCEQGIRTLVNLIEEERAKAVADGIRVEEMTEQEALRRASHIAGAVQSLAQELGVVDLQIKVPACFDEIAGFRDWVKTQTDDLWARAPDVLRQETLAAEQQKLITLKGKYEAERAEETTAQEKRDEFVKQSGDEAALVKECQELQQSIHQLRDQIGKINARANLVEEAMQYLRDVAPDTDRGQCPLCGADTPKLLSHLETEWEEKIKAEVQELEVQRRGCQSRLEHLESLKGQLEDLEGNLERAHTDVKQLVTQAATALGRKIGAKDDPLALLNLRLKQIASELELTGQAIAKKREKISGIYDQLAKLRVIHEILSREQKRVAIEHIWKTKEFAELEELMNQASQLVEDVGAIKSALAKASQEEAEAKIHAAGSALDKYFRCIAKHPAIPGLVMEVTEDRRTGLNSYAFRSSDGSDPTPILSQGDLNCLALSLFLGLAEATGETQRFAFLMLDDPTQSLGPEMKRELVGVLEGIADHRRLIIATPDKEFEDLLTNRITKNKAIYSFLDWTESGGPQVTRNA